MVERLATLIPMRVECVGDAASSRRCSILDGELCCDIRDLDVALGGVPRKVGYSRMVPYRRLVPTRDENVEGESM